MIFRQLHAKGLDSALSMALSIQEYWLVSTDLV